MSWVESTDRVVLILLDIAHVVFLLQPLSSVEDRGCWEYFLGSVLVHPVSLGLAEVNHEVATDALGMNETFPDNVEGLCDTFASKLNLDNFGEELDKNALVLEKGADSVGLVPDEEVLAFVRGESSLDFDGADPDASPAVNVIVSLVNH